MQAVIAKIAPQLAVVLGQKLAAQAVPVLGAVAGAATNYAYTSYYQDMAHVHFGLRKLAIDARCAASTSCWSGCGRRWARRRAQGLTR